MGHVSGAGEDQNDSKRSEGMETLLFISLGRSLLKAYSKKKDLHYYASGSD